MSINTRNTNGYKTRSSTIITSPLYTNVNSHGSIHRISNDIYRLINQYLRFRRIHSFRQCIVIHRLFIIVNSNIGTLLNHGRLSQNIYCSATSIQKHLTEQLGIENKQVKHALKQLNLFCKIYEETCLSDNHFIPVELFREIFSYITNA